MVNSNILLAGHAIIILVGLFVASPYSRSLYKEGGWRKIFNSARDRMLTGLTVVLLGGFTVSTHTWWFHNKYHEMGGDIGCSAFGSFSCGDVLANADYNTVPLMGIPWGMVGMLAFAVLAFLVISVRKEPSASWVSLYLNAGYVISGFGILIALYLLYVEIFPLEMTFCQYCSLAHIADVIAFVLFLKLKNHQTTDEWAPEVAAAAYAAKAREKRRSNRKKSSGFVKPTSRSGDEEE
jgi:uncharacterized membrane protein